MNGQSGWRFCDKCFGMFFNGDPNFKGRCPAGEGHHAQGFVFYLPHGVPDTEGQPGWRFCDKCFGMFFNGDPNFKGRCKAGGGHNAQGLSFVLPHDVSDTVGQPGWRFCDRCFGMFFNGDPNFKGSCPAAEGEVHRAQGFLFVLPHRAFPNPSITCEAIIEGQPVIKVTGSDFEPNQNVRISSEFRLSPSGTFSQPTPHTITSESTGRFVDRIPVPGGSGIQSVKVGAFDFGSGETAIGLIES